MITNEMKPKKKSKQFKNSKNRETEYRTNTHISSMHWLRDNYQWSKDASQAKKNTIMMIFSDQQPTTSTHRDITTREAWLFYIKIQEFCLTTITISMGQSLEVDVSFQVRKSGQERVVGMMYVLYIVDWL